MHGTTATSSCIRKNDRSPCLPDCVICNGIVILRRFVQSLWRLRVTLGHVNKALTGALSHRHVPWLCDEEIWKWPVQAWELAHYRGQGWLKHKKVTFCATVHSYRQLVTCTNEMTHLAVTWWIITIRKLNVPIKTLDHYKYINQYCVNINWETNCENIYIKAYILKFSNLN